MENLDLPKLKIYALVFLVGVTLASVVWVFVVPKNSSCPPSSPDSSLQKVAGAEAPDKGAMNGSTTVVVDVSGAVKNPGVYSLPVGSRLGDALTAAGGVDATQADAGYIARSLNLASEIHDGQKIYVPFTGEAVSSLSSLSPSSSSLVSINTGSSSQLDSLPGIGLATAAKIVAGRPYAALEDLMVKKVVSQSVFEKIKSLITL